MAHAFHGGAAAAHIGEAAENLVPEILDTRRVLARHGEPICRRIVQSARLASFVVVVILPSR
jgi:hypothetical protein